MHCRWWYFANIVKDVAKILWLIYLLDCSWIRIFVADIPGKSAITLRKFRIILERNHPQNLKKSPRNDKLVQKNHPERELASLHPGKFWSNWDEEWRMATIIRLKQCNHFEIFVPKSVYLHKRRQIRNLRSSVYLRRWVILFSLYLCSLPIRVVSWPSSGAKRPQFGISAKIGWAMKAKMVVQVDGIQKAFWRLWPGFSPGQNGAG